MLSTRVRRRINRFADLALKAANDCYSKVPGKYAEDKGKTGCIFSTAYGPLETNLEFAKQIVEDEPDDCSPIIFSNTVHNACLGTIAIHMGITGPSTMLLGSNHLWLSEQMLAEGKADLMLAGAVEEYNEELQQSLSEFNNLSQPYADAAVVLALRASDKKSDGVKIKETFTLNLGVTPFENRTINRTVLAELLNAKLEEYGVDAIILNHSNEQIGKEEEHIIGKNFPEICRIDKYYDYFGNALGADMSMKILLAKMILEKGAIPKCLCSAEVKPKKIERIAVLALDITGNYYVTILEK